MDISENIKRLRSLPANCQTLIIVLGQCALPTGLPHPWLIQRAFTTYELLIKQKINIQTAYIVVSGSDVSNRQYCIGDKNKKHITQAEMLYRQLNEIHESRKKSAKNQQKQSQVVDDPHNIFAEHIIIQDKANTTIENFYYTFKMVDNSKLAAKIKQIFIVTSDFHMNRSKFVFETLFFNGNRQVIGNQQNFDFKNKVKFIESQTKWKSDYEKQQKFQKQSLLLKQIWLIDQAKKTSKRLWSQINLS